MYFLVMIAKVADFRHIPGHTLLQPVITFFNVYIPSSLISRVFNILINDNSAMYFDDYTIEKMLLISKQ